MSARLVVMASGEGSNLQALIDSMGESIVGVFCNRIGARALERARQHNIPSWYCPLKPYRTRGQSRREYDADLALQIKALQPDLVVLAGWMHIFTAEFVSQFSLINVHPALLPVDPSQDRIELPDGTWSPVFRGAHTLEDAMAYGVTYVGPSVHWVTAEVDTGRLILSEPMAVLPGDTVETVRPRLRAIEHRIFPAAVRLVLQEALTAGG